MNILLLWTDQQRFDTLAAAGNLALRMPNLNALARTSTVFESAYCSAPVCTPSRGSVMSGLYAHGHGAVHNNEPIRADCPTIAEHLRTYGDYASSYIGKWHLGDEIFAQHGWDEWHAVEDDYQRFFSPGRDQAARSSFHHWLCARGYAPPQGNHYPRDWCCMLPERDSKPAFCAEQAIGFLARSRGRPWVLSINTLEPHHPLPGARNGEYEPAALPVRANFLAMPEDVPLRIRMQRARWQSGAFEHFDLSREAGWRQAMSHYWGLCTQVDAQYGRILDALRASGQFEDTLIIHTSDHGEMMGEHYLFGKGVPYEASVHVPLLIKLPGQSESRRVAQPVSLTDLCPTILDCAHGVVPPGLHGRSLRRLADGGALPARDVLVQWHGKKEGSDKNPQSWHAALGTPERLEAAGRADFRCLVAPEGWKLAVTDLGEWELYDLSDDPCELRNRARDPDCRGRMAELRSRLLAEMARVGDGLMTVPALP